MHYRTTKYRVYSQNTHISIDSESLFTVYNNTSWHQNVRHIWYTVWILDLFFFLWNLYIYSSVRLLCIFLASVLWRCKMGSHVLPPTCLGILDWRKCCDCVAMTQPSWPLSGPPLPSSQLFTDPTCLAMSLSSLCLSLCLSAAWCWHGLLNAHN